MPMHYIPSVMCVMSCVTHIHTHIMCITYAHHDHIMCIMTCLIARVMCALSQPHYAQGKLLTSNLACDLRVASKRSNVGPLKWS